MKNEKPKQEKPKTETPRKREPYRSKKDGLTRSERILDGGGAMYQPKKYI